MAKKLDKIKVFPTPASEWAEVQKSCGKIPGTDDFYVESEWIDHLRSAGGLFVNDAFLPLWDKTSGLMFLAGGYGSSKTTYIITRLLEKCLNNKYFKCFYGREKKTEARQLHSNIIREIKRNHWEKYFDYSEKPNGTTQILCIRNGNKFELFGCDDVDSLKGIDNPTDILVDEINQISFETFGMLFTRLRTPGCELQMIGCFNNCDVYSDHWLRKYFYPESLNIVSEGKNSGNDENVERLLKELEKFEIVKHHSKYTDNWFLHHEKYYAQLAIKAGDNQERLKAYVDGDWGVKLEAQPFYKSFKRNVHVDDSVIYDPRLPLAFSFDENVNPYLPALIIQHEGNEIRLIDEITAENPYNKIDWVCEELERRYATHKSGLDIFGDATSKTKNDVKLERDENLYTIILDRLKRFNPVLKVPDSNPNSRLRGDFINLVFGQKYQGLNIRISPKCVKTIEDFLYTQEDTDPKKAGSKLKHRTIVNGIRGVQKYGHLSDCFDYYICEEFMWAYLMFQNGDVSHDPVGGGNVVMNSMEEDDETKKLRAMLLSLNGEDRNRKIPIPERPGYYYNEEDLSGDDLGMTYGTIPSRNAMD